MMTHQTGKRTTSVEARKRKRSQEVTVRGEEEDQDGDDTVPRQLYMQEQWRERQLLPPVPEPFLALHVKV